MADLSLERALQLDSADPLASFRDRFVIEDPDLIYLDGNSLGRLPQDVAARLEKAVKEEWGSDLIRGWNRGWWEAPTRIGAAIASLVGAGPAEVIVSDQTSLDLFKLASAALALRPQSRRIVTDTLNFPSDLYILQGLVRLLGDRHEIVRVGSRDDDITPDLDSLGSQIDEQTALVTLSHVTFKSGYLYDMAAITASAHRRGALVLWDLSHSVGAVPVELDRCGVDLAIGCTYKYLNGGPGAPAFLYVNQAIQEQTISPIWGWWGEARPFQFGLEYEPATGTKRFQTGTMPVLPMIAMEAGLAPTLEAGIDSLRRKSVALTEYAIELVDARLAPLGFKLGSPRDSSRRGSHVSVRHADGYRISRALIEEMNVIPDFREPDNLRLGFAPLYISYRDVWEGIDRIARVVQDGRQEKYPVSRLIVT